MALFHKTDRYLEVNNRVLSFEVDFLSYMNNGNGKKLQTSTFALSDIVLAFKHVEATLSLYDSFSFDVLAVKAGIKREGCSVLRVFQVTGPVCKEW